MKRPTRILLKTPCAARLKTTKTGKRLAIPRLFWYTGGAIAGHLLLFGKGYKVKQQQQNQAAIYMRLSRDDGGDSESNSIQTQRMMLRRYCKEQGFSVFSEYVDDGISGVTFEREAFKRMISDIEEGKVGIVVCKDLSRIGRNNALVAYYTEIVFQDYDIRFICINDGIDSAKGENEMMGFRSVINEYYGRVCQEYFK